MTTTASIPESSARPDGFPPIARLAEGTKHLRTDVLACISFIATKGIPYFSWNANKLLAALMRLSNATWEEQTDWHAYTLEELGEATGMVAEEVPIAKRELVSAGVWRQSHTHHDPNPASPNYDPSATDYWTELRIQQTGRDPRAYPLDLLPDKSPGLTDKCPGCGHVGDMEPTRQRKCRSCNYAFADHQIQRVHKPVDDGPLIYIGGKKVPLDPMPVDPEPSPEMQAPTGGILDSMVESYRRCPNCKGCLWAVVKGHYVCVVCGTRWPSIPKRGVPPATQSPSMKTVAQEPLPGAERPPDSPALERRPSWVTLPLPATSPRPWWPCDCGQWVWSTAGQEHWYCCNCGAVSMAEGLPP